MNPNIAEDEKGEIKLSDSTKYWIDSLKQNLIFIGDSNKKIVFKTLGLSITNAKQKIGNTFFVQDNDCEGTYHQNYFSYPIQDYSLNNNTFPLTSRKIELTIRRTKYESDLNTLYNNPENKDKTQDGLEVILNDYNFCIYPKSKWVTARYKIYDTIWLKNETFTNVIYTYYDTTGLSYLQPEIHPFGVYYSIPKGVIGFEFSNGERYLAD